MRNIRILVYASDKISAYLLSKIFSRFEHHFVMVCERQAIKHVEEIYQPDVIVIQSNQAQEIEPIIAYFSGKLPIAILGSPYVIRDLSPVHTKGIEFVPLPPLVKDIEIAIYRVTKTLRQDLAWLGD